MSAFCKAIDDNENRVVALREREFDDKVSGDFFLRSRNRGNRIEKSCWLRGIDFGLLTLRTRLDKARDI